MWNINDEITFLNNAIKCIDLDKLMIHIDSDYYVYAPKDCKNNVDTPQARNSLIGSYTEKWCKTILSPIVTTNLVRFISSLIGKDIDNSIGLSRGLVKNWVNSVVA